jgi:protocatechuate 3,4-dioxygenase, alpha subunit
VTALLTPSQTIGPFFAPALVRQAGNVLASADTRGERIRIEGRVLDGDGLPVQDALVEIWQANQYGRYNHPLDQRPLALDPDFRGFGRSATDEAGSYWFETVKPGRVPYGKQRMQAPHVVVTLFARGLLDHLTTRVYFPDEADNSTDPVLALVPAKRRDTLVSRRESLGELVVYRWDVVLQGAAETVFFNL